MTELAERCRVSKGAITQRVDRAVDDGLVTRTGATTGPTGAPPTAAPSTSS